MPFILQSHKWTVVCRDWYDFGSTTLCQSQARQHISSVTSSMLLNVRSCRDLNSDLWIQSQSANHCTTEPHLSLTEGAVSFSGNLCWNHFMVKYPEYVKKIKREHKGCATVFLINKLGSKSPLKELEWLLPMTTSLINGTAHILLRSRFHRDLNSDRRIQSPEC